MTCVFPNERFGKYIVFAVFKLSIVKHLNKFMPYLEELVVTAPMNRSSTFRRIKYEKYLTV